MNKNVKLEKAPLLEILLVKGVPKTITDMEADGQKSFVMSDTLPTKSYGEEDKAILESWGFVFGEIVEGDPLFQYCKMPDGWTKAGTSHSLHSNIQDNKGRIRVAVFYKAAWYDRSASYSIKRRYDYMGDYDKRETEKVVSTVVRDAGNPIWVSNSIPISENDPAYEIQERTDKQAASWLDKHFPDWRKADAYWDNN